MQIVSKINPLRLYLTDVMDVRGSSLTRGNLYIIWENTLEGFLNKLDDLNGNKTKFHINQVELLFAPLNRTSKFNNIPYRVNNLDKTVKKGMGAHKYKIVNSPSMLRNLNTAPVMFDLINFIDEKAVLNKKMNDKNGVAQDNYMGVSIMEQVFNEVLDRFYMDKQYPNKILLVNLDSYKVPALSSMTQINYLKDKNIWYTLFLSLKFHPQAMIELIGKLSGGVVFYSSKGVVKMTAESLKELYSKAGVMFKEGFFKDTNEFKLFKESSGSSIEGKTFKEAAVYTTVINTIYRYIATNLASASDEAPLSHDEQVLVGDGRPEAVSKTTDDEDDIIAPDGSISVVNEAEEDGEAVQSVNIEDDDEAITVKKELIKVIGQTTNDEDEEVIDEELMDSIATTNVNQLEQDGRIVNALFQIEKKKIAKQSMHPKRQALIEKSLEKAKLNNTLIKDVINRATDKVPEITLPFKTLTGAENTKFNKFNKHYDEHTRDYDIVQTAMHLAKADVPLFIEGITTAPNDKNEMGSLHEMAEMSFKDEDGNAHHAKIKIPTMYRGKLLINNTRYTIDNQELPLVVTRDRDAVVITANYNKMYIENLYGKFISPSMSRLVKLTKALMESNQAGLDIVMTDCSSDNKGVSICADLVEVSREIKRIVIGDQLEIYASHAAFIEAFKDEPEAQGDGIYRIGTFKGEAILMNTNTSSITFTADNSTTRDIAGKLVEIIESLEASKEIKIPKTKPKCRGSYGKLMGKWCPLVLLLAYTDGLYSTLDAYDIQYKVHIGKKPKGVYHVLEFTQDTYLEIIADNIEEMAFVNPLMGLDLIDYNIEDLEDPAWVANILETTSGSGNFPVYVSNFKSMFIDNVTVDVLKMIGLPDTFQEVVLYANTLLYDATYKSKVNLGNSRIRGMSETVTACAQKAIFEAYSNFAVKRKRGSKNAKFSVDPDAAIKMLMGLPNVKVYDTCNPISDIQTSLSVSKKGLSGTNVDQAFTLDNRLNDSSAIGVIALATQYGQTTGIAKNLTVEPAIEGSRGIIKPTDPKALSFYNFMTAVEASVPGVRHDDSPRIQNLYNQSMAMYASVNSEPPLVCNGFEKAIPYRSEQFSHIADEDGVVVLINDRTFTVQYKSGAKETFPIQCVEKHSGKSYYTNNSMDLNFKLNQRFKKGEILAYNNRFYKKSMMGGIQFTMGPIAKVMLHSFDGVHEDAVLISDEFAKKMMSTSVKKQDVRLKSFDRILSYAKPYGRYTAGTDMVTFIRGNDDEFLNKFLQEREETAFEDINTVKKQFHYAGDVISVRLYYCCEKEDLSPSILGFVNTIEKLVGGKGHSNFDKFASAGSKAFYSEMPRKVKVGDKINGTKFDKGDILVEYHIEHPDFIKEGDKVSLYTALKGMPSKIVPRAQMPIGSITGDSPDIIISPYSPQGRKVFSYYIIGYTNKALLGLKDKVVDLYNSIVDTKKACNEVRKYVTKVFDLLDPTKTNSQLMLSRVEDDKVLIKLITTQGENFTFDTNELDVKPTIQNTLAALDFMGIPDKEEFEIYSEDPEMKGIMTEKKISMFPVHVRALHQKVFKENAASSTSEKRNKLNQVVGDDKSAMISDMEVAQLTLKGYDALLEECLSVRADNDTAQNKFFNDIKNTGRATLPKAEIHDPANKVALNKLYATLLSANIETDLLYDFD